MDIGAFGSLVNAMYALVTQDKVAILIDVDNEDVAR